ncbi:MAG: hypothetical protein ACREU0_10355, partial [Burkholderiales bacterium]
MRHFLCSTHPPSALTGCVSRSAAVAALVANASTSQRLASADRRALARAVDVAAVAAAADPNLLSAVSAVVEPMSLSEHRPARSLWDWTT